MGSVLCCSLAFHLPNHLKQIEILNFDGRYIEFQNDIQLKLFHCENYYKLYWFPLDYYSDYKTGFVIPNCKTLLKFWYFPICFPFDMTL